MNKFISKYIRKFHRYLTLPFIFITFYVMVIQQVPLLTKLQKGLMLTLASTGLVLFLQITINKRKKKKK